MEYTRQLNTLWNWLPAFRAIAESQSLQGASQVLHVTPSALSRSLKQLETELGTPLFDRVGRKLALNAQGAAFLSAVRRAMRQLHDGVGAAMHTTWQGQFSVWCPPDVAEHIALPALLKVFHQHQDLEPRLDTQLVDWSAALLAGTIDVAISEEMSRDAALVTQVVGAVTFAIYGRRGHPLLKARKAPTQAQLAQHGFVAVLGGGTPHVRALSAPWIHRVSMQVASVRLATQVSRQTDLLVLLPDAVGRESGLAALKSLKWTSPIHAVTRVSLGTDRTRPFVEALLAIMQSES